MGKSKPTDHEPLEDNEEASSSSKKPRLTQPSIVESFSMWSEEGPKTKDIERAIMQLICVDALPLQTVTKSGFRNLLKVVLPQWKHLKSRTHFTRIELLRLFEEYKNRLKAELEEVDHLAVSFDLYADEGNLHQVIGVVAHFVRDAAQLYRVLGLIDVKNDNHRGVVIKNKLEDLFDSYDIQSKVRKIDWSACTEARGMTASAVIPLAKLMISDMESSIEYPVATQAIANKLKMELQKYEDVEFLNIASALDPCLKRKFRRRQLRA